jgi:hypothetical protein
VLDRAESIRNYFGYDHVQDKDTFSKLFFAIVAPSMTGKTQAAFTFKRIRCLYFLLSKTSKEVTQEIYKNFENLSKAFKKMVTEDFEKLMKLNTLNREVNDLYEQISSTELYDTHCNMKFKTLGFVYALIEHGNANFDPNGIQSWMHFYATSSKSFIIESKSLNEFQKLDARGYALFFDEFEASDENAFVRNLFRAALAPVLVANTNSNVANLVGKLFSRHSRVGDSYGWSWSLAAVMLNDVNRNILYQIHPNLDSKIREIARLASNDVEKGLIELFFNNFFTVQLKHLRPGFAHIIAAKISEMPNLTGFTLDTLLQIIVGEMAIKLTHKKFQMNVELEGVLGSLALFMDNAYISSNTLRKDLAANISHMKSYLQYHFYYFINPVDVNNWCFLTYRPIPGDVHLRVKSLDGRFVKWDMENTYFRAEENIPLFACQSVINSSSIPNLLKQGLAISDSSAFTTGRTFNPSQNVPLNGDELEVLSSICIIEASQHGVGCLNSSFSGQDGRSFLTNLIGNLIEAHDYRRNSKIDLNCSIIGNYLECVHIPFLFPAGMKLPVFFKKHLSSPDGFLSRSVNFGEFKRTKNSAEIDGTFTFFIRNVHIEIPSASIGICTVECKNWRKNLLAKDLIPILKKAMKKSANISFLFCNSLGSSKDETMKLFADFCTTNKLLVLKVDNKKTKNLTNMANKKKFMLARYCPYLPLPEDIKLTCLIIELDTINKISNNI